jgi:hypothetical protein
VKRRPDAPHGFERPLVHARPASPTRRATSALRAALRRLLSWRASRHDGSPRTPAAELSPDAVRDRLAGLEPLLRG